jgi:hypothetical protein
VSCRKRMIELVESARTGLPPGAELQGHLRECTRCKERWDEEQSLNTQFQFMRYAAAARPKSETRRHEIMREFALEHQRAPRLSLRWAFSIAAILLLAVALGQVWRNSHRPTGSANTQALSVAQNSGASSPENSAVPAQQAILAQNEFSEAADFEKLPEDSDFVAVPFAPPLATGEFVRVVRTELRPIALARMGFYVSAAAASEITADVVFGEDGFPRAVRVLEEMEF